MKLSVNSICPCGSLKKYKKCCKLFHDNIKKPSNALELMKSRFSAFAFFKSDYIIKTTHQKNCVFSWLSQKRVKIKFYTQQTPLLRDFNFKGRFYLKRGKFLLKFKL